MTTQVGIIAEELDNAVKKIDALEHESKMAMLSFAKVTDVRESENHVLERHQQLHDEVENVKGAMRKLVEGRW